MDNKDDNIASIDTGIFESCTRTPRRRSTESTQPSRISEVRNVITPMRSETTSDSKPTVRAAELLSGNRNVQEANASNRKVKEIHNLLDREYTQPERGLTWTW
jgi:hypothetical protein